MNIEELLTQDAIKTLSSVTSKKRLFQELSELAFAVYGLCPRQTMEALQEREALGPTGVGNGVALPHARINGLDRVVAVFLRLEKPLDFDSPDRQPADLFFALFAPKLAGVEHLKALASVSRTMRDADVCAKLRANNTAAILHTVLTEGPTPQSEAA